MPLWHVTIGTISDTNANAIATATNANANTTTKATKAIHDLTTAR